MSNPLVTINIVVLNGEKYIRHCLDAVKNQTYNNLEINIFDNGSTDGTKDIISKFPKLVLFFNKTNLGMWGGQEKALEFSNGKYVVALSVDVLMAPDTIEKAVELLERDEKIGALQAKIYQYDIGDLALEPSNGRGPTKWGNRPARQRPEPQALAGRRDWFTGLGERARTPISTLIDTVGFQIERSRRITNIGHGEEDRGQYDKEMEIFGVEGAAPIFRKEALLDSRVMGEIVDHDMFWYGDDVDLA